MMALRSLRLPKAISESEREAGYFPIVHRNAVIWEAMLVHYHVIKGHLASYPPDDVGAAVWANGIITIAQ